MQVLGIDPGTALTGYAIVEETAGGALQLITSGVLETETGTPLPQRLQQIYRGMHQLLATYAPPVAAVEALFFSRNVRTAMAVGQARGVVLLALAEAGLSIVEYTPLEVKQAITGYGGADKRQVQEMVRMLLQLPAIPRPDDAADAVAIAICGLHRLRLDTLLRS